MKRLHSILSARPAGVPALRVAWMAAALLLSVFAVAVGDASAD